MAEQHWQYLRHMDELAVEHLSHLIDLIDFVRKVTKKIVCYTLSIEIGDVEKLMSKIY